MYTQRCQITCHRKSFETSLQLQVTFALRSNYSLTQSGAVSTASRVIRLVNITAVRGRAHLTLQPECWRHLHDVTAWDLPYTWHKLSRRRLWLRTSSAADTHALQLRYVSYDDFVILCWAKHDVICFFSCRVSTCVYLVSPRTNWKTTRQNSVIDISVHMTLTFELERYFRIFRVSKLTYNTWKLLVRCRCNFTQ